MTDVCNFNNQTLGEEISNAISHGLGAALSIAGTAVMIVTAALNHKGPMSIVGVSIYGASLILLYLTSCLYHSLANNKGKKVFQILDHCMIFILITGTYTPICFSIIGGWVGWTIWGFNMACTVLGIVFNAIDLAKWHKLSLVLYVVMGWSIVLAGWKVFSLITLEGWAMLLIGGIFYTVGIIFYRAKNPKYMHFIWHLFVLGGSISHFFFVLQYCCY